MTGGCLCGAVRYTSDAAPVYQLMCHCRDCQRVSGGPYAPIVFLPEASLDVKGPVSYFESKGASGKTIARGFCPECGSHLFGRLERLPGLLSIRAGTLDDPSLFKPTLHIHASQAAPWDLVDGSIRAFAHDVPPR